VSISFKKDINFELLVNKIKQNGFYRTDLFIDEDFDNSLNYISSSNYLLNENKLQGKFADHQFFFLDLLCYSKSFLNFLCSKEVKLILDSFFNNQKCRLKTLRYYETFRGHNMPWHTDNKNTIEGLTNDKGLIFIIYCEDTFDGEFQYVEESNLKSSNLKENYFSDEYVISNYKEKIRSFSGNKGTLVICDSRGIHRAKPLLNKKVRKSIFFQVDQEIKNSEPIYLNPAIFPKKLITNEWYQTFFGFEQDTKYELYPKTSIKNIPINFMISFLLNYCFLKIRSWIYGKIRYALSFFK
jgi:hypothetical protein